MKEEKEVLRFDYKRNLWRHVYVWPDGTRQLRIAWVKKCLKCGKEESHAGARFMHCRECSIPRYRLLSRISSKAHMAVMKAIQDGVLPPLKGQIFCVDCSRPAQCYDHRDYDKPLEVDPVCLSCNSKRGPAIQHESIVIRFPKRFQRAVTGAA